MIVEVLFVLGVVFLCVSILCGGVYGGRGWYFLSALGGCMMMPLLIVVFVVSGAMK